jgi:PPK2 family polyphosphate:nucleotide phosphotransferase
VNFDRYRVKAGSAVRFKDWDPSDKRASPGTKQESAAQLAQYGQQLDALQDLFYAARTGKLLVVLQGMDTSGKDGTIRHVFNSVDPLGVRVASFKAPTEEELDHDYLWRVHSRMPGKGEIVIFNRSHYEDVLIVRVRKWIDKAECERRYRQINDLERLLAETGTIILKFFLHISKDEQRKRLEQRLADPRKQWKFRLGDLDERKLWNDYTAAYEGALSATSTKWAPWYVVPANSKTNRNLLISAILIDALQALKLKYPKPKEDLSQAIIK